MWRHIFDSYFQCTAPVVLYIGTIFSYEYSGNILLFHRKGLRRRKNDSHRKRSPSGVGGVEHPNMLLILPVYCSGSSTRPAPGLGSIVVIVIVRQVWAVELIRQWYLPRYPRKCGWVAWFPRNKLTDIDRRYPGVRSPHGLHGCEHDDRTHGDHGVQKFH